MCNVIQQIKKVIVAALLLAAASIINAGPATTNKNNSIQTNVLHGSHYQMGVEYGHAMSQKMRQALGILENFYITQHGLSHAILLNKPACFTTVFLLATSSLFKVRQLAQI